jgi:2-amino-4-hydroxy-6-hydroxymethyldihydropteridine diphosphokinase
MGRLRSIIGRGEAQLEWKTAYLGLGSNLGDKAANLRAAVRYLRDGKCCCVARVSSLYVTKAVGLADQPDFLNAVVELRTSLNPDELLAKCREVERKIGRVRTIRWGPRVIDLDILIYENACVNTQDLVIPHRRLRERAFVLAPLAEIAPNLDVGAGVTAREALESVGDQELRVTDDASWTD